MTRRSYRIGVALLSLSPVGLAFSACGTQDQTTGSGGFNSSNSSSTSGTTSTSSSGSGVDPQCDTIPLSLGIRPECDQCTYQECCPELIACEKASPFCPWACAALDSDGQGCEPFRDLALALQHCFDTKCYCSCVAVFECDDAGVDGGGE